MPDPVQNFKISIREIEVDSDIDSDGVNEAIIETVAAAKEDIIALTDARKRDVTLIVQSSEAAAKIRERFGGWEKWEIGGLGQLEYWSLVCAGVRGVYTVAGYLEDVVMQIATIPGFATKIVEV